MKESEIQRYCLRYLKAKGYYFGRVNVGGIKRGNVWCQNPYTLKGVPDIIGFYKRMSQKMMVSWNMFAIECKSDKGKLSPDQIKFKEHFEASGGLYIVARNPEDIEEIL